MSRTCAILNCRKTKQDYKCPAYEMYSKSTSFTAMYSFVKKFYDDVYILSAKYGLIKDTDIIEPYAVAISGSGFSKDEEAATHVLTKEEKEEWVERVVNHPVWKSYDKIDCHVSAAYWDPIKKYISPAAQKIDAPTLGLCIQRYRALTEQWERGDRTFDSLTVPLNRPEFTTPTTWYHPVHGEYKSSDVYDIRKHAQQYLPGVKKLIFDFQKVLKGDTKHAKGWVIDKSLIPSLTYEEDKDRWIIQKNKKKPFSFAK